MIVLMRLTLKGCVVLLEGGGADSGGLYPLQRLYALNSAVINCCMFDLVDLALSVLNMLYYTAFYYKELITTWHCNNFACVIIAHASHMCT